MSVTHVVNGDSVARTLAQSGLPGSTIVWRDTLHEGTVPPGDPATVRAARAAFLSDAGQGDSDEIRGDLEEADAALVAALAAGRETVLWFEHDLHDQLQLIQILARVAGQPGRGAARLISLDRFPGHADFHGLGELSAGELATLWPRREPIADETLAAATRAYAALQASDPRVLAELAEQPLPGLPYLAAALRRLLEEHPWVGSGLARSERQILRALAAGARTPAAVFIATQEMEEAPYMGDTWLFSRIHDLETRHPALIADGSDGLSLTAAGQAELGKPEHKRGTHIKGQTPRERF